MVRVKIYETTFNCVKVVQKKTVTSFFGHGVVIVYLQANLWCTSSRAKKVVISLILGSLTVQSINSFQYLYRNNSNIVATCSVLFGIIVPVAVLVINVAVAIQVRRSAINAAANLGVQPHHQSTSAVPTIMLITTT